MLRLINGILSRGTDRSFMGTALLFPVPEFKTSNLLHRNKLLRCYPLSTFFSQVEYVSLLDGSFKKISQKTNKGNFFQKGQGQPSHSKMPSQADNLTQYLWMVWLPRALNHICVNIVRY